MYDEKRFDSLHWQLLPALALGQRDVAQAVFYPADTTGTEISDDDNTLADPESVVIFARWTIGVKLDLG